MAESRPRTSSPTKRTGPQMRRRRGASACTTCSCPGYKRGKNRTFGFRCVYCRHLPTEHGVSADGTASSAPALVRSSSEAVLSALADLDASPTAKSASRPSLYDVPAHRQRKKAVVRPKSFIAPDGEEYVSREAYLQHRQRQRDLEAAARAAKGPPPAPKKHAPPLDTSMPKPMQSLVSPVRRPVTSPLARPFTPLQRTGSDGTATLQSSMTSYFSTATQRRAPSFKFSTAPRGGRSRLPNASASAPSSPTATAGAAGGSTSPAAANAPTVDRYASPGPSDYDASAAFAAVSRRAPTFGMGARLPSPRTIAERLGRPSTPGPGAHDVASFTEENKAKGRGITLAARTKAVTAEHCSPGPATVVLAGSVEEAQRRGLGRSIGTRLPTHLEMASNLGYPMPPGPGAHELESFVDTNLRRKKGPPMPGRPRPAVDKNPTPSPLDYVLPSGLDDAKARNRGAYVMGRGPALTRVEDSPGPAYDIRPKMFSHTITVVDRRAATPSLHQLRRSGMLPRRRGGARAAAEADARPQTR